MKTTFESREKCLEARKWVQIDAANKVVGRLASEIAAILRGKNNPKFVPHYDSGDFVVVVNADKIRFTGGKEKKKVYFHHTGYIGGMKEKTADKLLATKPEEVLRSEVGGMLRKNPLGRAHRSKLKIYQGSEHPHAAQLNAGKSE